MNTYTLSRKTDPYCCCNNFVRLRPILTIFGRCTSFRVRESKISDQTDEALLNCRVRLCVFLFIGQWDTLVSAAKTAEPIEVQFGMWTRGGQGAHALAGTAISQGKRQFWGVTWCYHYTIITVNTTISFPTGLYHSIWHLRSYIPTMSNICHTGALLLRLFGVRRSNVKCIVVTVVCMSVSQSAFVGRRIPTLSQVAQCKLMVGRTL